MPIYTGTDPNAPDPNAPGPDPDQPGDRNKRHSMRHELDRAMALGYAAQDPDYKALKDEISNLQKQLKKNEDTTSLFAKLRERVSALLKRQSAGKQSHQGRSKSQQSGQEKRAA